MTDAEHTERLEAAQRAVHSDTRGLFFRNLFARLEALPKPRLRYDSRGWFKRVPYSLNGELRGFWVGPYTSFDEARKSWP